MYTHIRTGTDNNSETIVSNNFVCNIFPHIHIHEYTANIRLFIGGNIYGFKI